MLIKNTSYLFSLFSNYTLKGEKYNEDLKVFQININNFSRFKKAILDYKIINITYQYPYIDSIRIWDLDVIESKKMYDKGLKRMRWYIKWGKLFSCTNIEDMEPILDELLTKKEVYLFMKKLREITRTVTVMSEEEALREDDMFRRSLYDEGKKIGFNNGEKIGFSNGFSDGIMSMIKSMIDNHIDIEIIAKVSNKSIEEIDKIIKAR